MELKLGQYKSLLNLSRSKSFINGSFDLFIKSAITTLAEELEVSRASFWSYNKKAMYIQNELLYDRKMERFTSGEKLYQKDFPNYFNAFQEELSIKANDAITDPRTKEFHIGYLDVNHIKSMLDIQVSVEGELFGVICLEQTHEYRAWTEAEELFSSSIAAYIAQSFITKLKKDEETKRKQSESNYERLFLDSPIPMWVYDNTSFAFIDVNNAAIRNYGYTKDEFLSMTIFDIKSDEEKQKLQSFIDDHIHEPKSSGIWLHTLKNGKKIWVETSWDWTSYKGRAARIVTALDITKEKNLADENALSLKKFKEFAFYASHDLRGPVSRLLGLNTLLELERNSQGISDETLDHIHETIQEIDEMILKLNKKLEE